MSNSWYEDGQEVDKKFVMNIAKTSGRHLFMAIDDDYDNGYIFFRVSAR